MYSEYDDHIAQIQCKIEDWADQMGLTGDCRAAYIQQNRCGGWTVTNYDTLIRCSRCPDESGDPHDD